MSVAVLLVLTVLFFVFYGDDNSEEREKYDIVIYGGSFTGCAAARTAALTAPDSSILVIVPGTAHMLGGIGTAGGQNFFDLRRWKGQLVTAGSFIRWYGWFGQFYNTGAMSDCLLFELNQFKNIKILWNYDISETGKKPEENTPSSSIVSLNLREVFRDQTGKVRWGEGRRKITGRVFIDASEDGRLTRLSGVNVSSGRSDWPAGLAGANETWDTGHARQQAATLMFKISGVVLPPGSCTIGDLTFSRDGKGSWGIAGGTSTFQKNRVVVDFNDQYSPRGYALKPLNAAQDGAGSSEWWVNALLVFNVDGRACERDRDTACYPSDKREDFLDVDEAWVGAKNFLENPDFIHAFRQFSVADGKGKRYGFYDSELVRDDTGKPIVGDSLYLRETIHLVNSLSSSATTENIQGKSFALTENECQEAGFTTENGADRANYMNRIGLAYYNMDINAYKYQDLKPNGNYNWPVTGQLRPDWQAKGGEPANPVYLPFEMLVAHEATNLLVPGYATGASSLAWAEIRVIPNLCVLGDAAGVAAARSIIYNENPALFTREQINWVQDVLRSYGVRLDK